MPLVIVHAPCHGPSVKRKQLQRACSAYGAHSIGFSEVYRRNPFLRKRPRWRMTVGTSTTDKRRGPKDNPILTRRNRPLVEGFAVLASRKSTPVKIAPERWLTGVVFRHPVGLVGHLNLHPHAAVVNNWGTDRAEKYRDSMRVLEREILRLKKRFPDIHIVVTGDLNYPVKGPERPLSPHGVFKRTGLHWRGTGVDWVAWSPNLKIRQSPERWRVIPAKVTGQDHPWIRVAFVKG